MINNEVFRCRVCRHFDVVLFCEVEDKIYWRCQMCQATFMDPAGYLLPVEERAHYDLHENDISDPGYRAFLSRLGEPLISTLKPNLSGLDYGCGPGAALADLLRIVGHEMSIYDPFYAPDTDLLNYKYDFITCSETVEHFHDPAREFVRFDDMLKAGGLLAIMTNFQIGDDAFANWYYRRDPTHVVFYRRHTFEVLAAQHSWHYHFPAPNVAFLTKPSDTS